MLHNDVLDDEDLADGIRLGCQSLPVTDTVKVSYSVEQAVGPRVSELRQLHDERLGFVAHRGLLSGVRSNPPSAPACSAGSTEVVAEAFPALVRVVDRDDRPPTGRRAGCVVDLPLGQAVGAGVDSREIRIDAGPPSALGNSSSSGHERRPPTAGSPRSEMHDRSSGYLVLSSPRFTMCRVTSCRARSSSARRKRPPRLHADPESVVASDGVPHELPTPGWGAGGLEELGDLLEGDSVGRSRVGPECTVAPSGRSQWCCAYHSHRRPRGG